MIAPDKSKIAPDIARSPTPAFAAFLPAKLDAAITPANNVRIFAIALVPFFKSPLSILANIFIVPVSNNNAADIARIPIPPLAALAPANLLDIINAANAPKIVMSVSILFFILAASRFIISSNTPTNSFSATTIARIPTAEPILIFLHIMARATNPPIAPMSIFIERSILSNVKPSISFRTPTMILNATEIPIRVIAPFDNCGANLPSNPATIANPEAITPNIPIFCHICSWSRPSMDFKVFTSINSDAAIPSIDAEPLTPLTLLIVSIAAETANNPRDKAPNALTADHNLD